MLSWAEGVFLAFLTKENQPPADTQRFLGKSSHVTAALKFRAQ